MSIKDGGQDTSRKLATIRKIDKLEPIKFINKETGLEEVAESIQLAVLDGWQCVVLKSEFKEAGELAVYFEIDSIIPRRPWNIHIQKDKPDSPIRLKTVRLRGQLSQGLALPISILEDYGTLIYENGQVIGVSLYDKNLQDNK